MIKFASGLLDLFDPSSWAFKVLIAGAFVAGIWFGIIRPYNNYVSGKAVLKEEARVVAIYDPLFKSVTEKSNKLTKDFNDLTLNVVESRLAAKTAASTAVAQEKLIALNQTDKYEKEIKLLKANAAKAEVDRVANARITDERVRNATSPLAAGDGSGQQGIRLSGYTDRLSGLYAQCDKDLGELIETAAGTLQRLAEAEAAVRALSPTK